MKHWDRMRIPRRPWRLVRPNPARPTCFGARAARCRASGRRGSGRSACARRPRESLRACAPEWTRRSRGTRLFGASKRRRRRRQRPAPAGVAAKAPAPGVLRNVDHDFAHAGVHGPSGGGADAREADHAPVRFGNDAAVRSAGSVVLVHRFSSGAHHSVLYLSPYTKSLSSPLSRGRWQRGLAGEERVWPHAQEKPENPNGPCKKRCPSLQRSTGPGAPRESSARLRRTPNSAVAATLRSTIFGVR